jgi:hypothetical protein
MERCSVFWEIARKTASPEFPATVPGDFRKATGRPTTSAGRPWTVTRWKSAAERVATAVRSSGVSSANGSLGVEVALRPR